MPGADSARGAEGSAATRRHLRGSSLLLLGRLISLVANFAVQVLTVRYLAKTDYGAYAYATALVSMGTHANLLGLNKAVARFLPIYETKRDDASLAGGLLVSFGALIGLGLAIVCLTLGLRSTLIGGYGVDAQSVGLLMILVALVPLGALDGLFQSLVAVFAHPRAIFWRRHVLGPGLRLAAILFVMATSGSVRALAVASVVAGALGVAAYAALLRGVLARQGWLTRLRACRPRLPSRELLGFGLPLLASDLGMIGRTTLPIIVLEAFRGVESVAELRAVVPLAGLNLIVLQGMKPLFLPTASRLFAREDPPALTDLFWKTALWTALLSFPIAAVTTFLADPLTVALFGERYARAGTLLAVLAIGNYIHAALGLNSYVLQVYARVHWLLATHALGALIAVGLAWFLAAEHGALGAAIAISVGLVVQNLVCHVGLVWRTDLRLGQLTFWATYAAIAGAALALFVLSNVVGPTAWLLVAVAAVTLALLRLFRRSLDIEATFPELARVPLLGALLGLGRGSAEHGLRR